MQSDCPASGTAGCCATVHIPLSSDPATVTGAMCGNSCPGDFQNDSVGYALLTKLCKDAGDCASFYGTIYPGGIALPGTPFDHCCSAPLLSQKFCANATLPSPIYTCN
jgi:hypothetical protein